MTKDEIVNKLSLQPHPEGGYFAEVFKSNEYLEKEFLPGRYNGRRSFFTSIYYLLDKEQISHLHKVNSDETWYFHIGSSVRIHILDQESGYSSVILGGNLSENEVMQYTVKRGSWFAAELTAKNSFGLFSCAVAPGFEYDDFELADRKNLEEIFPDFKELISQFTIKKNKDD